MYERNARKKLVSRTVAPRAAAVDPEPEEPFMKLRSLLGACAIAVTSASLAPVGAAADYPNRPITFIAPFAAGSTTDGAARVLVQSMSRTLGQPGVIDNKVGAGGTIGLTAAARSKPDGYTFVFTGMSAQIIASFSIPDLPWNPVTSFAPVGQVATVPLAIAVTSTLPAKTLRELLDLAKARPGQLTYGTLGPSTAQSLAMAMLMQRAGITMREVPYKTSAQILTDVSEGRVDVMIDNAVNVLPGVQGGRLRPLAVSTAQRVEALPDVPTVAEAGLAGYNVSSWVGLVAPAGTPPEAIAAVSAALQKALETPEYRQWLRTNGALPPEHPDPKAFAAFIERELKLWKSAADLTGAGMPK